MASLKNLVNAAANISNTLFEQSPKEFYSLRDFYNFIKKRQNAPMAMKHFTIVPKTEIFAPDGNISRVWDYIFNDTNLARFALLAQSIQLPSIKINNQGYSNNSVNTPFGNYTPTPNSYPGGQSTLSMLFLQTGVPIIQTFIVPWFYECLRTNNYASDQVFKTTKTIDRIKETIENQISDFVTDILSQFGLSDKKSKSKGKLLSQYPCPKLTLDIKYYRMDQIAGLDFLMNPNYVYRVTGLYPIGFQPPKPEHGTQQNLKRRVDFAYNNIVCIPNAQYQTMLYNGGNSAFSYRTQSPVQILNALNAAGQDVSSIIQEIQRL